MHEYDDGRDGDDRRRRDILNPVQLSDNGPTASASASSASPSAVAQPPRHSFNLRSPTQPELHHHHQGGPHFPTSTAASPSSAAGATTNNKTNTTSTSNGTRSLLHNPFLAGATAPPSLPPPILPSAAAPPPRSPLHAPPVFYPQDIRDPPPREKTAGSFYDPTTDTTTTTKDRRLSDTGSSWHNATQAPTSSSASKVSKHFRHDAFPFFFLHVLFCFRDAAIKICSLELGCQQHQWWLIFPAGKGGGKGQRR